MTTEPLPPLRRIARRAPAWLKREPVAAAVGNASLLGVGYLILGRYRLAALAAAGSLVLVIGVAATEAPAWPWRAALLAWWAASIAHGWYAGANRTDWRASEAAPPLGRRPRATGLGAGALVLLAVLAVAVHARVVGFGVTQAHEDGDCAAASERAADLGALDRIVDGLAAADAAEQEDACALVLAAQEIADRGPSVAIADLTEYLEHPGARWDGALDLRADVLLDLAAAELTDALTSGATAAADGFDHLATVLDATPDRADEAQAVVDGFLAALPAADACAAMDVAAWTFEDPERFSGFEGVGSSVAAAAPAAILGCGAELTAAGDYDAAVAAYELFLDEFPDHPDLATAQGGFDLATVRPLLDGWPEDPTVTAPSYCRLPEPLSTAPDYAGAGPHRMALFGFDRSDALPGDWLAADITEASIAVCSGSLEEGERVGSCDYEGGVTVEFFTQRFQVTVINVRTGEQIYEGPIDVGGDCPDTIYFYDEPPSSMSVDSTDADFEAAFESLVNP